MLRCHPRRGITTPASVYSRDGPDNEESVSSVTHKTTSHDDNQTPWLRGAWCPEINKHPIHGMLPAVTRAWKMRLISEHCDFFHAVIFRASALALSIHSWNVEIVCSARSKGKRSVKRTSREVIFTFHLFLPFLLALGSSDKRLIIKFIRLVQGHNCKRAFPDETFRKTFLSAREETTKNR